MEKVKFNILTICLLSMGFSFSVSAQMFAPEASSPLETKSALDSPQPKNQVTDWSKFYGNQAASATAAKAVNTNSQSLDKNSKQPVQAPAKQMVTNPQDYIYKNVPQVDRPTLDGVKRGRTSVTPLVRNGKVKAEGYIYLYYTDFSLRKMMSGSMSCDVKLQIVTTLDRRLNSLAVRLVWPHMQTPVTFLDVNPNQKYQMPYTLLGDGCYSMDKIPNIVVNRCRVKGVLQEECASRVRWMRKM